MIIICFTQEADGCYPAFSDNLLFTKQQQGDSRSCRYRRAYIETVYQGNIVGGIVNIVGIVSIVGIVENIVNIVGIVSIVGIVENIVNIVGIVSIVGIVENIVNIVGIVSIVGIVENIVGIVGIVVLIVRIVGIVVLIVGIVGIVVLIVGIVVLIVGIVVLIVGIVVLVVGIVVLVASSSSSNGIPGDVFCAQTAIAATLQMRTAVNTKKVQNNPVFFLGFALRELGLFIFDISFSPEYGL